MGKKITKKLYAVVLGFAVFLVVLLAIVIPQQGGLIASTDLETSLINNSTSTSNSTLPIQDVGLGNQGRSVMIATAMLAHILLANLGLGGSFIAVFAERSYIKRQEEQYEKLSHSLTFFNIVVFSTGSTFAFAGVLFFISLYPGMTATLFHIYFWPLVLEAFSFGAEIFFLYTYYYLWNKISRRKHQILGYGWAITVLVQTFLIDMVAGGMLTPGAGSIDYTSGGIDTMALSTLFAWWFNPSLVILTAHRTAASLSYVGFVIAMLAMFRYNDRKDEENKRYWNWVGTYAMWWGIGGLIAQVPLGMVYAATLQFSIAPNIPAQVSPFDLMMHGERAWEMLLMVGLFAVLFLIILVYFMDRREFILSKPENAFLKKMFNAFLIIAAVCAFFLVQPAWYGAPSMFDPNRIDNPIGSMSFKYVALLTFLMIGIVLLIVDSRMIKTKREELPLEISAMSRVAAIMAGILGMWIVIVMGYTRESIREPWTILGIFPVEGGSTTPTPVTPLNIFMVWMGITFFTFILLYFVSKRTAYTPETADSKS